MLYLNLCQLTLLVFVISVLSIDENNAINSLELSKRLYILRILKDVLNLKAAFIFVVDLAADIKSRSVGKIYTVRAPL